MNKSTIAFVNVFLDDNVPEYMSGVIRCGSVTSEDENGNRLQDHEDLVDNLEFHSYEELIESVSQRLGVSPDRVGIQD
jgi:hypothetical protein